MWGKLSELCRVDEVLSVAMTGADRWESIDDAATATQQPQHPAPVALSSWALCVCQGLNIADHEEAMAGTAEQDIDALRLLQEADRAVRVAAHQGGDDDVTLLTLHRTGAHTHIGIFSCLGSWQIHQQERVKEGNMHTIPECSVGGSWHVVVCV
jgi:hypothetical protein